MVDLSRQMRQVFNRNRWKKWLALACLLACFSWKSTAQTAAQPFAFELFNEKNGLQSSNVTATFCDRDGFLWVGTEKGLSRFDGLHFLNFPNLGFDGDRPVVAQVSSITQAADGLIWIAHWQGMSRLDPHSFAFHFYNPVKNLFADQHSVRGTQVIFSPEVGVCATSVWGFWVYEPAVDTFRVFLNQTGDKTSVPDARIWFKTLVNAPELGGIWIGTAYNLSLFDAASKTFFHQKNNPKNWVVFLKKGHETTTAIGKDGSGNYWFSFRFGSELCCFNPKKNHLDTFFLDRQIPMPDNERHFLQIKEVLPGQLWMSSANGGIYLFDLATKKIRLLEPRPNSPCPSVFEKCTQIYQSPGNGDWWFSTSARLFRKRSLPDWLTEIECPLLGRAGSWGELYFDAQNRPWLRTTAHEWAKMDEKTGETHRFGPIGRPDQLDHPTYTVVIEAAQPGLVWLTSEDGPLLFDTRNERFVAWEKRFPALAAENRRDALHFKCRTRDGLIWMENGQPGGLFLFDDRTDKITKPTVPASILVATIRCIFQDSEGLDWFCFAREKGAASWNPKTGEAQQFNPAAATRPDSLNWRTVQHGMEDSAGNLWFWTMPNEAAARFDKKAGRFLNWPVKNDLNSLSVSQVLEQPKGIIWFSGNRSLAKFSLSNSDFSKIRLPNNLENDKPTALISADRAGFLWIGYQNKLVRFHPDSALQNQRRDLPTITQISLSDKNYAPAEFAAGLVLPFEKNALQFFMSNLSTLDGPTENWLFKLEGFHKNWQPMERDGRAIFTNLQPGDYRFMVKRASDEPFSSNPDMAVSIKILPPWWQTWWFRGLVGAAILASLFGVFRQRTQRLLQKQRADLEKQQALERERSRIARDMHDDLGSGLSAIHLLSNFAKNREGDPVLKKEMEKIAQSSAALNQNIREIIWTVNAADDSLASLVHFLRRFCHDFAETVSMEMKFEAPEILPEKTLAGEVRRNLFLCVKEALNNAAKYSNATHLQVKLTVFESKLEISIRDNGPGFDLETALEKGGNGLRNIQKRMEDIGGTAGFSGKKGACEVRLIV